MKAADDEAGREPNEFNSVIWDAAGGDDRELLVQALRSHGHLIDTPHPDVVCPRQSRQIIQHITTPLHRAAEKGNVWAIETLIQFGSQALDASADVQWTPLHVAACHGHVPAIEALLHLGSKAFRLKGWGETWSPLHAAAENGQAGAIEAFFRLCTAEDFAAAYPYETPMYLAALAGHVGAIEALGRCDPAQIDEIIGSQETPMHAAAGSGHVEAVRALIRMGSQATDASTEDYRYTPMQYAAQHGHFEVVELLVRFGTLKSLHINSYGGTPVRAALYAGHEDLAKFCKSMYNRPLLPASEENFKDDDGGIEVTEDEVVVHRHRADFSQSLSERLLFELERLPWIINVQNMHKLWAAVESHDDEQLEETLTKHRSLIDMPRGSSIKNGPRMTLMQQAAMAGNAKAIELLVRLGSRAIDVSFHDKSTPMQFAVLSRKPEPIEMLVRLGCQTLDVPDESGYTPLRNAARYRSEACAKVLKALGARSNEPVDIEVTEDEAAEVRHRVYFAHSLVSRLLHQLLLLSIQPHTSQRQI